MTEDDRVLCKDCIGLRGDGVCMAAHHFAGVAKKTGKYPASGFPSHRYYQPRPDVLHRCQYHKSSRSSH